MARDNGSNSTASAEGPDQFIGAASSVDGTEVAVNRPSWSAAHWRPSGFHQWRFPVGDPLPFAFQVQLTVGYGNAYMTCSE